MRKNDNNLNFHAYKHENSVFLILFLAFFYCYNVQNDETLFEKKFVFS